MRYISPAVLSVLVVALQQLIEGLQALRIGVSLLVEVNCIKEVLTCFFVLGCRGNVVLAPVKKPRGYATFQSASTIRFPLRTSCRPSS